jgi:hypothetical protein
MARVSIARWNLKEAAGKALARRTENAYEACKLDEKANIFKVRYLYGTLFENLFVVSGETGGRWEGPSSVFEDLKGKVRQTEVRAFFRCWRRQSQRVCEGRQCIAEV